jgi:8-oxo-dGTP pyrophosphatase MutT (NUDIX family)
VHRRETDKATACVPPIVGTHYHIETDGEVYLVRDGTQLRLPRSKEEIPFPITQRFSYDVLEGETVHVCTPHLEAHPQDWHYKDDVPMRRDVSPITQKAINTSLPRCVVGIALLRDQGDGPEVLLVRANRGMTTGMWNIPGGFIEFNEHPEQAVTREAKEELGIECRPLRLLGVYSEMFKKPGDAHHLYGFMYLAEGDTDNIRIDPDEIGEYDWFPLQEAHDTTRNPFAKQAFARLLEQQEVAP